MLLLSWTFYCSPAFVGSVVGPYIGYTFHSCSGGVCRLAKSKPVFRAVECLDALPGGRSSEFAVLQG